MNDIYISLQRLRFGCVVYDNINNDHLLGEQSIVENNNRSLSTRATVDQIIVLIIKLISHFISQ